MAAKISKHVLFRIAAKINNYSLQQVLPVLLLLYLGLTFVNVSRKTDVWEKISDSSSKTYLNLRSSMSKDAVDEPDYIKEFNQFIYTKKDPKLKDANEEDLKSKLFIEDIFIGIKTTKSYHDTRLRLGLSTWVPLAKSSVSGSTS